MTKHGSLKVQKLKNYFSIPIVSFVQLILTPVP